MTAPRWFFPLLAACVVLLTLSAAYRLVVGAGVGRYEKITISDAANTALTVLDTRTGQLCPTPGDRCMEAPKP